MSETPKRHPDAGQQIHKFRELARKVGADEDPEAFKAKLVKVAKAPKSRKREGQ